MSFYDTERIVRKQQKHEKTRAYATISKLENKGLSVSEMIDALDILLKDDNTEFQQAVLDRAKSILESRKEIEDEKDTSGSIVNLDCGNRICPVLCK